MNYRWSKNPGFRCTNKVVPQPVVNKVTTPLMGVMINPSDTHWFSAIKIGGRFLSLHSYRSARGHLGKNILVVTFSCMTLLLRTKKNGGIPSWFARVWILPNGIVCSPKNHPPYTVPLQNGWTWVAYRRFVGYKKREHKYSPWIRSSVFVGGIPSVPLRPLTRRVWMVPKAQIFWWDFVWGSINKLIIKVTGYLLTNQSNCSINGWWLFYLIIWGL